MQQRRRGAQSFRLSGNRRARTGGGNHTDYRTAKRRELSMPKLFLVAGEASGDARGAELMKSLLARDSSIEFSGLGGPQMRAIAGEHFHDWSDRAVIGLLDVLKNY